MPNGIGAAIVGRLAGARSIYFSVGGPTEVLDGGGHVESKGCFRKMETLYAVVEYQGSYKGGHYIVTVYDFENDIWRVYNDSLVSDRIFQKEEFRETAYILFYEKLP